MLNLCQDNELLKDKQKLRQCLKCSLCLFPMAYTQVLQRGEPYPQVILPQFGGYWIEDAETTAAAAAAVTTTITGTSAKDTRACNGQDGEGTGPEGGFGYPLERNSAARAYRKHFLGKVSHYIKVKLSYVVGCVYSVKFASTLLNFSVFTAASVFPK